MKPKNHISGTEITILTASTLIGVGIVTLPSVLAGAAGPNAWISVLIGWIIATVGAVAITKVMRRFPRQNLITVLERMWGKVAARSVGSVFAVYLLIALSTTVRQASDDIKTALLPRTPLEIIILSLLIVAVYVAREGIEPISRMLTLLFPLAFVPVLIAAVATKQSRLDNLLPVMADGIGPVFKGALLAIFSFVGFEGLFIWMASLKNPEEATRAAVKGVGLAGLVYTFFVVVSLTVFTPHQLTHLVVPFRDITDAIDLPLILFERLDVITFSVWITVLFTTLLVLIHLTSRFLQVTLGFRTHTPLVLPLIPIIYILALLPRNTEQTIVFQELVGWVGLALAVVFPLILWAVIALRERQKQGR